MRQGSESGYGGIGADLRIRDYPDMMGRDDEKQEQSRAQKIRCRTTRRRYKA